MYFCARISGIACILYVIVSGIIYYLCGIVVGIV